MKRFSGSLFTVFAMLVILFPSEGYSKKNCDPGLVPITLKMATLAPGVSVANEGIHAIQKAFDKFTPKFGICMDIIPYWGGVMGDDPQMIQKAKAGQLDMLAITLNGLPLISNSFDIINMAYLIEDYGMFDYVINKNATLLNQIYWDNGWIGLSLIISDGAHNLYMDRPLRTVEDLKNNLKAANYTGGPDESFYKAMGINQTPLGPTELFPSVRSGVVNAALLPSAFAAGMQLYTKLNYIVEPPVRYSTSTVIMAKRKWETLPWEFRVFMAFLQPAATWGGLFIIRDLTYAFMDALVKHGCKQVVLTKEELKAWKDQIATYREEYVGNDPLKRSLYNAILKSIQEYKTGNPIEKQMYLADPTCKNFPDKVLRIGEALKEFTKTRNPNVILNLDKEKVLEKWRVYDAVIAQMDYAKTGSPKKLEQWMRSFYVKDVCDEIFSKHLNEVKKLFGSEKAIMERMNEVVETYNIGSGFYKGFQKYGIEANDPSKKVQ